ncbi:hypothetical protein ACLB2K_004873 [Fragaria x ananassa]
MSDRSNGLLGSFNKVLPGHPHLFCYMHLSTNLMNRYGGVSATVKNAVKNKFFELAYASSPAQYRLHLRKLREIGDAKIIDDFLKDMPLENRCHAFFPGSRYGIMANSMAESFNAWFAEEREMPAYGMLDQTRIKLMNQMGERRDEAQLWTTPLTPKMQDRLKEHPYYFADYCKKCYDVPLFPLCNADMASTESANDEFVHLLM